MKFTPIIFLIFLFLCIAYGSAYAGVSQGLKYFTPGLFQTFRMTFGFLTALIILILRYIINSNNYKFYFKSHFRLGYKLILHLIIGGLLNMGIPHCLISIAQKNISSASIQLMQPIASTAGAIFGHFILEDEKFTLSKFYSLIFSLLGVILSSLPSFNQSNNLNNNISNLQLFFNYFLVFFAVILFGIAPGYFKWAIPNCDITISAIIQILTSAIFNFFYSLITDGFSKIIYLIKSIPFKGWIWPFIIGVLVSGVAIHGFMYLIIEIGSFGANLIPFGQILVGLSIGIFLLNEWKKFNYSQIFLSIIGIIFLIFSLIIGFKDEQILIIKKNNNQEEEDEIEEEEINLPEL